MSETARRQPVGAEVLDDGSVHFRVWAPAARQVAIALERRRAAATTLTLEPEEQGYLSLRVPDVSAGDRYRYLLDGRPFADPASRFQPEGPFGPSQVIDPGAFSWQDRGWGGIALRGQVLCEIHVGTFTTEGTWQAAAERLPLLKQVGVTAVEIMPIAEFPGRFGWGYDGVFPYAPTRLYGDPDDFRRFVDRAHAIGMGVVLDVVYNHLGPAGCVHREYAPEYFSAAYDNEWGDALNFDGRGCAPVREYFVSNAGYWIDEFHLDGLRLDATQSIHDRSSTHLIAEITARARDAARGRSILVIAENERQECRLLRRPAEGGYGLDAVWNDDFHHSAVVAMTGHNEAYYSDHRGVPQEFISAARHGYLFQGQRYAWQRKPRGTRADGVQAPAFICFTENHDQLANSGGGARLHARTAPGLYRAMTALLLLMPGTPMLFQGQEFGATSPFLYFADHDPELASAVRKGRLEFLRQFPTLATSVAQALVPAPDEWSTFERCKLRWDERDRHVTHTQLVQDLLTMRRTHQAFAAQDGTLEGAVIGSHAFLLRFSGRVDTDERLLLINLGNDFRAGSLAEPLAAPPDGCTWSLAWSSEHPDYGGQGPRDVTTVWGWYLHAGSANVLAAVRHVPDQAQHREIHDERHRRS